MAGSRVYKNFLNEINGKKKKEEEESKKLQSSMIAAAAKNGIEGNGLYQEVMRKRSEQQAAQAQQQAQRAQNSANMIHTFKDRMNTQPAGIQPAGAAMQTKTTNNSSDWIGNILLKNKAGSEKQPGFLETTQQNIIQRLGIQPAKAQPAAAGTVQKPGFLESTQQNIMQRLGIQPAKAAANTVAGTVQQPATHELGHTPVQQQAGTFRPLMQAGTIRPKAQAETTGHEQSNLFQRTGNGQEQAIKQQRINANTNRLLEGANDLTEDELKELEEYWTERGYQQEDIISGKAKEKILDDKAGMIDDIISQLSADDPEGVQGEPDEIRERVSNVLADLMENESRYFNKYFSGDVYLHEDAEIPVLRELYNAVYGYDAWESLLSATDIVNDDNSYTEVPEERAAEIERVKSIVMPYLQEAVLGNVTDEYTTAQLDKEKTAEYLEEIEPEKHQQRVAKQVLNEVNQMLKHRRATQKYEENAPDVDTGYRHDILSYTDGEEGSLNGITDDAERAYVILQNKDRYKSDLLYGEALNPIFYMDPKQEESFIKYMNAGMKDEAAAYLDALRPYLNKKMTEHYSEKARGLAQDNGTEGIKTSLGSIGMKIFGAVPGTIGMIASAFGSKEAQDPNSLYYFLNNMGENIQAERIQKFDDLGVELLGENWRGVGANVFSAYYSAANMGGAIALGGGLGGSEAVPLLILTGEAGSSTFAEELRNGRDPTEALILGAADALFEFITEKWITLERVLKPDIKDIIRKPLSLLKYMGKSVGAELSEEAVSKVLNTGMDNVVSLIAGHENEIQKEADRIAQVKISEGMDAHEAIREGIAKATGDWWKDMKDTLDSTAISTIFLLTPKIAGSRMKIRKTGQNIRNTNNQNNSKAEGYRAGTEGENIRFLAKTATLMDPNTETYQLGKDIIRKYYKGEKISNLELGRLAMNYETEASAKIRSDAKNAVTTEIRDQLVKDGTDRAVADQLSEIVYKARTQGIKALNKGERSALNGNDYASQILTEMMEPGKTELTNEITEKAEETAKRANIAQNVATMNDRVNLSMVQGIAEGKGILVPDAKIGKDRIGKARELVGKAKDETIQNTFDAAGIARSAASVIAYTSDAKNGDDAKVGVISGFKDGKVQVSFDDGTAVSINPAYIETTDDNAQALVGFKKAYDGVMSDAVATVALDALNELGDKAAPNFANDVVRMNMAAWKGAEMPATSMDSDVARRIYDTALKDARQAEANRFKGKVTAVPGKGGATWDGAKYGTKEWTQKAAQLDADTRQQAKAAAEIAQALGHQIEFIYDDSENGKLTNGSYDEQTGVVTINLAAQRMTMDADGKMQAKGGINPLATIPHELTHWLQQNSQDGYARLQQFVIKDLASSGVDIDQLILNTIDNYNKFYSDNKMNRTTSIEDAMYEIVANASEALFTSEEFANRLKKADAGLFGNIKDYVKKLVSRVKAALTGARSSMHFEARNLRDIDEMARIWLGAYDEVIHGAVTEGLAPAAVTNAAQNVAAQDITAQNAEVQAAEEMAEEMPAPAQEKAEVNMNPYGTYTKHDYDYELDELEKAQEKKKKWWKGKEKNQNKGNTAGVNQEGMLTNFGRNVVTTQKRLSIAQINENYMQAVESGDQETQRQMVDAVAYNAGYGIRAYHGSNETFTQFKPGERGEMWLSSTPETAYDHRKQMYDTYIKMTNPYEETDYIGRDSKFDPVKVTEEGRSNRHDGAIVHWRIDPVALNQVDTIEKAFPDMKADDEFGNNFVFLPDAQIRKSLMKEGETLADFIRRGTQEDLYQWYAVYQPEQIKSADLETHYDNGNVIPLTERFNPEKKDIRYSVADFRNKPESGQKNKEGSSAVSNVDDIDKMETEKENPSIKSINNVVQSVNTDEEYLAAVERGDIKAATEMLMNKLKNTSGIIPFIAPHWDAGRSREIAQLIKKGNTEAVAEAAADMAKYVPDNAVLIPMPDHTGKVNENTDTMILAKAIGEITGRPVVDALRGVDRESRRLAKHENRKGASQAELGFYQAKDLPEGTMPVFVDNVVGAGVTADAAREAIGGGITLAFTKSLRSPGIVGLKNAIITYDKNRNVIPLSQRFDISKRDVRRSIAGNPEIDIDRWMMSVPESSLATEAERELLRQYKNLTKQVEVDEYNVKNLKRQIRFWMDKKGLTKQEKGKLDGLKIRLANAQNTQKIHEKQLEAAKSDKGFAKIMHEQQERMNRFTSGKTQQEVIAAMDAMEESTKALQKSISQTAEELKALAESRSVREIRSRIGGKTVDEIATRIRKNYNSTINKQELMNELAKIRLMIEDGQAEAAMAEVENLAGQILEKRKGSQRNESLEQLRGITLRLSDSAIKEIYGSNSNIREIRKMLAGSGVKVVKTNGAGSLDADWNELISFVPALDHYNGYDTDNALNQVKAVAEFVQNAMEEQRESGKNELKEWMDDVIVDLAGNISMIDLKLPADPAARKAINEMKQYVMDIAQQAEITNERIRQVQKQMDQMLENGRKAANWNRSMKDDIAQTIDYFNMTAKLAVEKAKQTKQAEIIQQLKDENVQKILKNNDEWRALIQRDADAREQADRNAVARRKMTVAATRLAKLLSSPTNTKNIPEVMNPLARKLVEMIVSADLSEGGRKISNIQRKDLFELKRRLDAWNMRDGVYDPKGIADETIQDKVNDDLDVIAETIREWNGKYQGKNKLDTLKMMGETLNKMQEAVSEIYTIIQKQREIVLGDRRVDVEDQAYKVKYQTHGQKKRELTGSVGQKLNMVHKAIVSGNMTPEYFFRMLDNSGLSDLWEGYHEAENRNGLELRRMQQKVDEVAKRHGYDQWDLKQKVNVQLESGDTVEMTIGQLMSLWATWNREQTLGPEMSEHLTKGGFYAEKDTQEGILGRTTNEKKAHRVTANDMARVAQTLTEEQKAFVDDIVKIMSNDLSQLGNEASMKAYGIKMYKEKYYFPFQMWDGIKSRKSNDSGSAAGRDRAFHPSFSKTRMHGANNALIIGDFMRTAMDHMVGMINYATMGLANDNFQKVLNQTVTEGETADNQTKRNIRTILEEAYGKEAMDYLKDLQDHLNGGAVATRKTIGDKLISVFRKNAVAGSLSVALQQPLSYLRAALMINPKYLTGALGREYFKGAYQELLQHSGVAVIKDMGRFDMGFGQSAREYLTPDGKQSTGRKIWEQIKDKSTALPELMDMLTWTRMWVAVKAEQQALHPDMDVKSDKFLDMCAVRFNDIMRRTQVYDSTLVKSMNMRSDNYFIKGITSFMGEPTLTLNVLADAARQVKKGEKGAKGRMAGAAGIYILSAILQAVFKGIMGAGRSPDEKKTMEENLLNKFAYNFINEINPLSQIPGYGDIIDQLKSGEVQDDALAMIGKMTKAGTTGLDMLLGRKEWDYRNIEDSAAQILQLFSGVPAKNIMRDVRATYNLLIKQPYADRETSEAVLKYQTLDLIHDADNLLGALNAYLKKDKNSGYATTTEAYSKRIYEARKAGNTEKENGIIEYLLKGKGVKEDTINSNLRTNIKKDETTTAEEKVNMLKDTGMSDSSTASWIGEQYQAGEIDREEAERLYRIAKPDARDKDIYTALEKREYKAETGNTDENLTAYFRIQKAMDAEDKKEFDAAKKEMMDAGYEEKDIQSSVLSYIKKQYKEGEISADEANKKMKTWRPDMDENDRWWTLDRVDYQKETGNDAGSSKYYRIYNAMDNNNANGFKNAKNAAMKHGVQEKDIHSNVLSYIRKQYSEGKISATEAKNKMKKWRPDMTDDDIFWTIDREDYKKATGKEAGSGTYYRLWDAMSNNSADGIGKAVDTMLKHGVKKENIKSQVTGHWKQEYLKADSNGKRKIRDAIEKAYRKLGYDPKDADKIINGWK